MSCSPRRRLAQQEDKFVGVHMACQCWFPLKRAACIAAIIGRMSASAAAIWLKTASAGVRPVMETDLFHSWLDSFRCSQHRWYTNGHQIGQSMLFAPHGEARAKAAGARVRG